jgi:hypothetical protein
MLSFIKRKKSFHVFKARFESFALYKYIIHVYQPCDWSKVILQKSISKTANHSSKPPFCILFYSKYFRRFAHVSLLIVIAHFLTLDFFNIKPNLLAYLRQRFSRVLYSATIIVFSFLGILLSCVNHWRCRKSSDTIGQIRVQPIKTTCGLKRLITLDYAAFRG